MTFKEETVTPHFRFHDCDATRVDPDIADALVREFEYTIGPGYFFEFYMEEKDFYAILAVIDSHNAPALIEMGLTTPHDVIRFLQRQDLQHLIRDNAKLTEAAMRLSIPVGLYFDIYSAAYGMIGASSRIAKGLEKHAELRDKKSCRVVLLPLMVSGTVSYEDAEIVGYDLMEENRSIREIVPALITLQAREDEGKFSASDIRKALTENLEVARKARMKLLVHLGAQDTFAIQHPARLSKISDQEKVNGRASMTGELALFIDAILSETSSLAKQTQVTQPELPPISMVKRMHSAGVDPVWLSGQIMGDTWDENYIMALHNGITQPLTGGWL